MDFFQKNSKHNIKGDGQSHFCHKCGYSTFSQDKFKDHEKLLNTLVQLIRNQYRKHGRGRIDNSYSLGEITKYKCR